jgi:hypothetical protein
MESKMIQWLCNKIYWAGRNYDDRHVIGRDAPIAVNESPDVNMDRALRFNLLPARGGCVFEIRKLDTKTHDWNTVTHVIPDGADVAHEVGQLVAMELLRH